MYMTELCEAKKSKSGRVFERGPRVRLRKVEVENFTYTHTYLPPPVRHFVGHFA